jgi:hypothetical protein
LRTARSTLFRQRHHGHLDLAYRKRPREGLDLFLAGTPVAPIDLHPRMSPSWSDGHHNTELHAGVTPASVAIIYATIPQNNLSGSTKNISH